MIKEPAQTKSRAFGSYRFLVSQSDQEHIQREREYWRFDPYEDIGPLFFSDLYEGREGEPWG